MQKVKPTEAPWLRDTTPFSTSPWVQPEDDKVHYFTSSTVGGPHQHSYFRSTLAVHGENISVNHFPAVHLIKTCLFHGEGTLNLEKTPEDVSHSILPVSLDVIQCY
ncbi:hypothetical protein BHE74_00045449 [Ensete ventricosum]|nr:hypothetical protein GW17_00004497 [Ensete ventricosum]RWW48477.1 hypothetical protein BHE74_00045449 [Ensete ventricosum]RZS20544.1 hypothetical protein BHM03_00053069 [Ensete ventricosum]